MIPIRRRSQRGNAVVEMGLIFLPLMMTIFSSFEITRGMWMYQTLSSAIKSGTRYAVVHGQNCADASDGCQNTVADVVAVIKQSGMGLDASQLQLTLTADGSSYDCTSLASCATDRTQWPPTSHNAAGIPITIQGRYAFQSAISVLWPGQTSSFTYLAKATEVIQF